MRWTRDDRHATQISLLCGATVAGYPAVAALSSIFGFDNRLGSIAFRLALIAVCFTILLRLRLTHPKRARIGIWFPLMFFWMLYLARVVWDAYLASNPLSREPYFYLVFALGSCLIPMMAFMVGLRTNERMLDRAREATVFMVTAASAAVLWVFYNSTQLQLSTQRMQLDALNPISVGHLGGSLVILSIFCLFQGRKRLRNQLVYWVALPIGMVLLVSSASRGPVLATALALGAYAMARLGSRRGLISALFIGVFFVGGAWLASFVEGQMGFSSVSRIVGLIELGGSDLTASIRLSLMRTAWAEFLSSPLVGSGLEGHRVGFYPHNAIVEAFMATGIVGGIALLAVLASAGLSAWRLLTQQAGSGWTALLCIQYIVAAQFSGALWGAGAMWSFIGAVFAVSTTKRFAPRATTPQTAAATQG